MRMPRAPLVLLALLALPAFAWAEPLRVSGRVLAPTGAPLAGAKLELRQHEDPLEAARDRALGSVAEPIARAVTDDAGRYALDAPHAGAWTVRVEVPGFVPVERRLHPLVDSIELEDLSLEPDAGVQVRVLDPSGAPVSGATVVARTARGRFESRRATAGAATRRAETGPDGTARIPRGDRESLDLSISADGFALAEIEGHRGTSATARLTAGAAATIEVVGADGARLPGARAFVGSALAHAGRTDDLGRVAVTLRRSVTTEVSVLAADGRRALRLLEAPADGVATPIRFVLPNRHVLVGRVIDAETRRPVPEVVVWDVRETSTFASTDRAGGFALGSEIGQLLEISAAGPGYVPATPLEIRMLDDGRPGLTLPLRPAAAVEGAVVDGDGRAIAGAEVTLEERRAPGGMMRIEIGASRAAPRARSDARGRFRIASIDPSKSWNLRGSAEGFAAAEQAVGALEPYRTKGGMRLALSRGRSIVGSVVDGDEAAIPGALVRATKASAPEGMRMIRVVGGGADAPPIEATTGDDGRFVVRGLPDGKLDVEVRRRGYAPRKLPSIEVGARAEAVDLGPIVLAPGEMLQGHVRERAGAPIEGAEIFVREATAGPVFLAAPLAGDTAREPDAVADAAGFFSIPDLSAERRYTIEARRRGYVEGGIPSVELPRLEPLDVVLEPASDITGRVVDARREGVAGARVALERTRTIELGGNVARTIMLQDAIADAEGRFRFEDEEPGTISLSASAPGYQEAKLDDLAIPAGQDVSDLILPLPSGAIVEGRVVGPDGCAAIGASVRAVGSGPDEVPTFDPGRAGVDGDGYYRLDSLAPGSVSIEATHDDYPRVVRDVELREGRNALDFAFSGGTEVTGFVRSDGGTPVADALVSLLAVGRSWGGSEARSSSDGSFRFLGVTPGTYRARAEAHSLAAASPPGAIEVSDQPVSGLEIVLSSGATVSGTIRGVAAEQLVDVSIQARGGSIGSSTSASPDYRGLYRIEHLPPGTYTVQARLGSTGRQASGEVTLEADAGARLDLEFGGGVTLSGEARTGETPVEGATLFVEGLDVEDSGLARTDQAGRFVLAGLDPGTYRVDLREFASGVAHTETVALATSREIVLRLPANRLAGSVVDAAGRQPLAGVSLTLGPANGGAGPPRSATTDVQGRFALASIPDGEWKLTASRKSYAAQTTTVAVTNGRSVEDVRLALDATEGLLLEVRLPSGAVPGEVQVAVLDAAGSSLVSGHYATGEQGSVRLASVPPGEWALLVSAPGAATSSATVRAPGPKVQIALRPATALRVEIPPLAGSNTVATARLRDAAGIPFRTLGWSGSPREEWPVSGGRIEFGALPPDTWTVEIATADGRTWRGTATTTPAEQATLVLER